MTEHEQLIKYDTSKLAKEKGFDWNNFTYNGYTFTNRPCYKNNTQELVHPKLYNENNPHFPAPTQSVLMRWLRGRNIIIEIRVDQTTYPKYAFEIVKYEYFGIWIKVENIDWCLYRTYEEALEEALLLGLKQL